MKKILLPLLITSALFVSCEPDSVISESDTITSTTDTSISGIQLISFGQEGAQ